jgi:hypothetical protein
MASSADAESTELMPTGRHTVNLGHTLLRELRVRNGETLPSTKFSREFFSLKCTGLQLWTT